MSDLATLLARCRELGAELAPSPDGRLKVKAPAPLPEDLREALRRHKAEVLAILQPWPCDRCGNPAVVEEVCPSLDGTRTLTLWHCEPCQTYGVTPDSIRQPPVWVRKTEQ